jgi:hypothetical protein
MPFTFGADRIAAIQVVGDPVRLRALELSLLDDAEGPTPALYRISLLGGVVVDAASAS